MIEFNDKLGKAAQDFLAEAEEIIDQLSLDLVGLSDCADSGDYSPDLLNSIFRGAHSLKGLAGMLGFACIAELAHNLEDLLDSLRLGKISLTQATVSVLFDSMDLLETLVREAGDNKQDGHSISEAVARINACITAEQQADAEFSLSQLGLPERMLGALTEYEEYRLIENARKGRHLYSVHASFLLDTFDKELGEITEILKQGGEVISTLPSAGGGLVEMSIDFELLIGSELDGTEIAALLDQDNIIVTLLGGSSQQEPELSADTALVLSGLRKEVSVSAGETSTTARSFSRTVRVDIGKLDELMNLVGELVLSHSTINELVLRIRQEGLSALSMELSKAAKGLERKVGELQKGVMDIRMVPVGQLFEKMSRIVRKTSQEHGKKVELKLFGVDTELDKLIIEDISDPVMHIVRNAIDHGIETPDKRLLKGKDATGIIRLSSFQKGNHVVIEVEDDGRGLDLEKVKRKAFDKGLIQNPEHVSDKEALSFIFLPGFSTSDKVTDISGRGVGLDVVLNNIQAISGMVDIESQPGAGSRVIITLPITLAIIKALIIVVAGRIYALPITAVLETIMMGKQDIQTVERKEVIQLRDTTLPLLRLDRFFELKRDTEQSDNFYVVVSGVGDKRIGIVVDDLLGQQDIVIKSIGESFKGVKGISGAADLGGHRTILFLDVGGMISEAMCDPRDQGLGTINASDS